MHKRVNKNIESEETLGSYKKVQNYIGDVYTASYLFVEEKISPNDKSAESQAPSEFAGNPVSKINTLTERLVFGPAVLFPDSVARTALPES